jgi:hypothetical protein
MKPSQYTLDQDFKYIIRFLGNLGYEKPTTVKTYDQNDAYLFLSKYALTSLSLWNLIWPEPVSKIIPSFEDVYINDFPSIFTLLRNLYESYLVCQYLLCLPDGPEKQLRKAVWEYKSLNDTEKMSNDCGQDNNAFAKICNERLNEYKYDKNLLFQNIKSNPFFLSLSEKKQTGILKNKSGLLLTYAEIAREANINPHFHRFVYNYTTAFAHPNFFGFRRLIEGNVEIQLLNCMLTYVLVTVLMLDFVKDFIIEIKTGANISKVIDTYRANINSFGPSNPTK